MDIDLPQIEIDREYWSQFVQFVGMLTMLAVGIASTVAGVSSVVIGLVTLSIVTVMLASLLVGVGTVLFLYSYMWFSA